MWWRLCEQSGPAQVFLHLVGVVEYPLNPPVTPSQRTNSALISVPPGMPVAAGCSPQMDTHVHGGLFGYGSGSAPSCGRRWRQHASRSFRGAPEFQPLPSPQLQTY